MITKKFLSPIFMLTCISCAPFAAANGESVYEPYLFTTFAGSAGVAGSADGAGSAASFTSPSGIAVDAADNIFVADTGNHTIRKITPSGVVSTLAGLAGTSGSADGTGSMARFSSPIGLALGPGGNIFVADSDNNTIRKITPGGIVTTVAGLAGVTGSADGVGAAARFNGPRGVAVDNSGNIFVADTFNDTIRKITPAGSVSTFAGLAGTPGSSNGTGSAARFDQPRGIAVDAAGKVYVADSVNDNIRLITPTAVVSTLAGLAGVSGSDDGIGSASRFFGPVGIKVDDTGNVFVADTVNDTIRKITPADVVTTLGGLPVIAGSADGAGKNARFASPQGVAVNSENKIFISDTGNNTIRVGGSVSQLQNISTRARVETEQNVMIGGFIITGETPKTVIVRAIGPSLEQAGLVDVLADPMLELHDKDGALITSDDNWQDDPAQKALITATGLAPQNSLESAIVATLDPSNYTAIVSGKSGGTGIGLVEVYDLDQAGDSHLGNISTRASVMTGNNVMIGGFIVQGGVSGTQVLIRAIGPTLTQLGVSGALSDPTLELHDSNGALISTNDNWRDSDEDAIEATGLSPDADAESAILAELPAAGYTTIVAGKNGSTGVALVEVYALQ
jgi:sugar lactone lactonase YvrE